MICVLPKLSYLREFWSDLVHLFTVLHLFMLCDAVLVARAASNRLGT